MPIVRSFAAGLEPAVFSIFITLPLTGLKILGVGSAAAVLIDATVPGVCDHPGRGISKQGEPSSPTPDPGAPADARRGQPVAGPPHLLEQVPVA